MMFWFNRHRRLRAQLSAYIDGALAPAAAGQLEAHLEECEGCRAELEQLRSTVAALRELPEAQAPRSFALSPERVAAPRPVTMAAPLAFGARIAAASVAAALAAVLVVDLGDLGGDGGTQEGAPTGMIAERQFDADGLEAEGDAVPEEAAPTGMMEERRADENGLGAEGDATAAGEMPEDEGGAPREPIGTPAAPETAGEDAGDEFVGDTGAAETPVAERQKTEAPATVPPESGGIDALTAAEIGLAAALGVLVSGSLVLAFAGRKR